MINPQLGRETSFPNTLQGRKMSFPNTRQGRNFLREVYGRYVLGKDIYPKGRVLTPLQELNPRVRPVAALLTRAWQTIDLDNAYFWDSMEAHKERLEATGSDKTGLVVAKSGQNAVNVGQVWIEDGGPVVQHGLLTPEIATGVINAMCLRTASGEPIRFVGGDLITQSVPDVVVIRDRPDGAASYFDGITTSQ